MRCGILEREIKSKHTTLPVQTVPGRWSAAFDLGFALALCACKRAPVLLLSRSRATCSTTRKKRSRRCLCVRSGLRSAAPLPPLAPEAPSSGRSCSLSPFLSPTLSLSLCVCVSLSIGLSLSPSVCLSLCFWFSLSIGLSVSVSVSVSVSLSFSAARPPPLASEAPSLSEALLDPVL
eukprot:1640416-Rhodomonas_salina.3